MRAFHVLNLGAGVQSTTLYLLSREGLAPKIDVGIEQCAEYVTASRDRLRTEG